MTILLAICAAVIVLGILIFYAVMCRKNEVKNSFATIDAVLKKRFDLLPKLLTAAKENAALETATLEKVIPLGPQTTADHAQLQKLDAASAAAVKDLLAQIEAAPEVKADPNFALLQTSLQETIEHGQAARRSYNAAAKNYNHALRLFPTNVAARLLGYKPADILSLTESETKA